MISISITSTNYNGKTGEITFYSVNDPATPVNLGSHLIPYVRTDTDVYGTYILNFLAYSKTCTINLAVPTTTTTTTTAPTTTTTTTAAPALDVRLQTMVGSGYSGGITEGSYTFFQDDVSGNPIFSNGPQYIFWSLGCWYLAGEYTYHNASTPPDEPSVLSSISGSVSVLPTGLWTLGCPGNFPGFLDNFYTTVTSPTTTTAAPDSSVPAYFVATNAAYGGKYCEDGTFDDGMGNVKPKYRKADTSFYIYYMDTNWRINDVGNLGNGGSNVYGAVNGASTPPVGLIWQDMDRGQDLFVSNDFYSTSATPTLSNTYVNYGGNTSNGKPVYYGSDSTLEYEPAAPAGPWVIYDTQYILLYQNISTSNTPPLSGWTVYFGSEPVPTLIGPTCDGTTTTTTTPEPTTTTTTTTAAPGVEGFIVSGAGDANYNGTYCPGGTANGGPYWQKTDANGTYYIMYYKFNGFWFIQSLSNGGLDAEAPDYYHAGTIEAGPRIDSIWDGAEMTSGPPPTLTSATCVGATTTTTAAPAGAFTLSGAGAGEVNGCYSEVGIHNGMPYYSNGIYFVWYEGFEWEWFITQTVGAGPAVYIGSDQNNVPSSWSQAFGPFPAPILLQGC